ncbi:hypothetical protein HDV01_000443 [Terramyces sp. JEL0728]|nr:hypothetical protein HDV01_000443 [Terramyces sp. JEL0728]
MKEFRTKSAIALPCFYISKFTTSALETFQSVITDEFVYSFFTNIQINNFCHVKKLVLKNSYLLTDKSMELILKYTFLKHVELHWNTASAERYLLENSKYLNVLIIFTLFSDRMKLNIKGLRKVIINKPSNTADEIQIEYDKLVHLKLTHTQVDQLFTYSYLGIKQLHLNNTLPAITDEMFKILIDACMLLEELHLEKHGISDTSIGHLNSSQCSSKMLYLGIVRCAITIKGVESLRLPRLKALNVSGNGINKQSLTLIMTLPHFVTVELLVK